MLTEVQILNAPSCETLFHLEMPQLEECLADDRACIRPSEFVQQKFLTLTRDLPVLVSSLQTRRMVRR